MLSHIVNLVKSYEQHHGARPNVVYLSETHYGHLREELPGVRATTTAWLRSWALISR